MREKLFRDIFSSFPCLTTIVRDKEELVFNGKDNIFLEDENRRGFIQGGDGGEQNISRIRLISSDGAKINTFLYTAEYPVLYLVSEREKGSYRIILGPFVIGYNDSRALHDYGKRHNLKIPLMTALPTLSVFQCLDCLCIAHEIFSDCDVEYCPDEMGALVRGKEQRENDRAKKPFSADEWEKEPHASFAFEQAFEQAILSGDRAELARVTGRFAIDGVGKMAASSKKQMEYMAVVLVTLVSRIAIRGGVSERISYRLSDYFLQKISGEKTTKGLYLICNEIITSYMKEIRTIRSDHVDSLHIERAKAYIRNHRNRPLSVAGTAEAIGVSGSYLSQLFRQVEHDSAKHFILKTKLEGAANMLRNSSYDIAAIAEYFCFSSPSHFASKFREYYGCTPGEFRKGQSREEKA